ncbi:MAG: fimbrillin family protein [Prevotella sp.]|nr:fimbrillin family protein [Prevotella sp.]
MTACTNETNEFVGSDQAREISFAPVAQPNSRAAVEGTAFDTETSMKVTAYDATNTKNFFAATTFSKGEGSTWKGNKYWPFAPATINFLAIANANADNETGVTWGPSSTNPTERVQIDMSDNSTAQRDLMYACGTGTVIQTGNTLEFPPNVPMDFKHAQAWVKFTVKAGNDASASAITVNSITLNSVSCNGTYLVTHANWNETKATRDAADPAGSKNGSVSGTWSAYGDGSNIAAVAAAGYSALSTSAQDFASLMVVPDKGMASFTINYTVDDKSYNYTYTPASTTLAQATKYIYNISLTLHEIEIAPTVANWTDGSSTDITL